MAMALPDDTAMEIGTVYSEAEGVNRKVQTWMRESDGKRVGEKASIFNKGKYFGPMFTPPSPPKKTQNKSVLNRKEGGRQIEMQQQHSRQDQSVGNKVPVNVSQRQQQQHGRQGQSVKNKAHEKESYDPREHTLKRRAQRANQALKEYQNARSPTRKRLREQRDEAVKEVNKLKKENDRLRGLLKEKDVLKRKYEELQKQGRVLSRVRRIVSENEQEERRSPAGDRGGRR